MALIQCAIHAITECTVIPAPEGRADLTALITPVSATEVQVCWHTGAPEIPPANPLACALQYMAWPYETDCNDPSGTPNGTIIEATGGAPAGASCVAPGETYEAPEVNGPAITIAPIADCTAGGSGTTEPPEPAKCYNTGTVNAKLIVEGADNTCAVLSFKQEIDCATGIPKEAIVYYNGADVVTIGTEAGNYHLLGCC